MKSHVNENIVVGSIRQQLRHPSGLDKIWIIVEGIDDHKLFSKLIDGHHVKIEFNPNGGGKVPLEKAVSDLLKETNRILGIRDADFLYLEGKKETAKNIFLTDFHDAEMMIISCDNACHAVVAEYLREEKEPCSLREKILKSISFIGGVRWINISDGLTSCESLGLNFDGLGLGKFYDGTVLVLDEGKCLNEIMKRSPNKKKEISKEDVRLKIQNISDFLNLCNGHDFQKAFASYVNSKSNKGINDVEIGKAFRIAYRFTDFQKTNLYNQLKQWSDNQSMPLFKLSDKQQTSQ
ncbi:MAG: hypothetical protein BWK80_13975 [Desulfobacteraceae bacterium IS3]|nr:MAG: hypothetical protein BWK80_13975 [Desulfobacteraceae bacterium IS3]HAO23435.1 hypothetical protein [Desulfobacteraceae bacterium]